MHIFLPITNSIIYLTSYRRRSRSRDRDRQDLSSRRRYDDDRDSRQGGYRDSRENDRSSQQGYSQHDRQPRDMRRDNNEFSGPPRSNYDRPQQQYGDQGSRSGGVYGPSSGNNGRDFENRRNRSCGRGFEVHGGGAGRGGGYGGGRGTGGRNSHMGEMSNCTQLLTSLHMSDESILPVVAPTDIEGRKRFVSQSTIGLPELQDWRLEPSCGAAVSGVFANSFLLTTDGMPVQIFNYSIVIYRQSKTSTGRKQALTEESSLVSTSIATISITSSSVPGQLPAEELQLKDLTVDGDERECTQVIRSFVDERNIIGVTYDGRKTLHSVSLLSQSISSAAITTGAQGDIDRESSMQSDDTLHGTAVIHERVILGSQEYEVILSLTTDQPMIPSDKSPSSWSQVSASTIRALDSAIFSFARWKQFEMNPKWIVDRSKVFLMSGEAKAMNNIGSMICRRGYQAALRYCLAGLVLTCDMSVTAFARGGNLVDILLTATRCKSARDLVALAGPNGDRLPRDVMQGLDSLYMNAKLTLSHLGFTKKFKGFGMSASSPDTNFDDHRSCITYASVAEYFARMHDKDPRKYPVLKHPTLPVVNVGSKNKPICIPMELCLIREGQTRGKSMTGEMVSQIIKEAAVRPSERMAFLTGATDGEGNQTSLIQEIRDDGDDAMLFGVHGISTEPMHVRAKILPPARLLYGRGSIVEPSLNGSWHFPRGSHVAAPPPSTLTTTAIFSTVIVSDRPSVSNVHQQTDRFITDFEKEANGQGIRLQRSRGDIIECRPTLRNLQEYFRAQTKNRIAFVFVILMDERSYDIVKLAADQQLVMTQCLRASKIQKMPGGYAQNVLLKVNGKLGGTNHTLASRQASTPQPSSSNKAQPYSSTQQPLQSPSFHIPAESFQQPKGSLSWLMDEPCMIVGIDLTHPDPGREGHSVAAIVASMDGSLSQFSASISAQSKSQDVFQNLEASMVDLINAFRLRNGTTPKRIIVFRDGVSDSQFQQVIDIEVKAIHEAMSHFVLPSSYGLVVMVAQKRHQTRLFYNSNNKSAEGTKGNSGSSHNANYVNVCPGVCVDATGKENSIASALYNDFFLNSHVAIQGTAKPCKYTILYDDIGVKVNIYDILI